MTDTDDSSLSRAATRGVQVGLLLMRTHPEYGMAVLRQMASEAPSLFSVAEWCVSEIVRVAPMEVIQ